MQQPNILLVVLDATRYDYCSCYGYERLTTPALDRLAEEGTLFENAIAAAPWTLPSFASMFTGLFPSQTSIYDTRYLDPSHETLAQVLRRKGYRTFVISSNSWLSTDFGLVRDFDTVHKLWQLWQIDEDVTSVNVIRRANRGESLYRAAIRSYLLNRKAIPNIVNYLYYRVTQQIDTGASRTLAPFKRWVVRQESPWFAVLHYMEAHLPYRPPRKWWRRFARVPYRVQRLRNSDQRRIFWRHNAGIERLDEEGLESWRDLYAAEVAYQDYHLGRLFEWLRAIGQYDSTCIIVVGDHGENLGEHGLLNHQYCLYETLIHVPLVVRYPPYFKQGERVKAPVSTVDIYQTILDVAGSQRSSTESQSLVANPASREFVISEYGAPSTPPETILSKFGLLPSHFEQFKRGLTSLRTKQHKLILGTDGTLELYDIQTDPLETNNLASRRADLVHELKRMLEAWWKSRNTGLIGQSIARSDVNPAVAERLRALGYLD